MATYDLQPTEFHVDNAKIAIVAARFNHKIVDVLLEGALNTLSEYGVGIAKPEVLRVPGAFELAAAAQQVAFHRELEAIITLGTVIRGDTPHFDYVCGECARSIGHLTLTLKIPIIFGVLTTNTLQQAEERAGGAHGNKGSEAALAALEMITLFRALANS